MKKRFGLLLGLLLTLLLVASVSPLLAGDPSADQEMLGLSLQPMEGWTPAWDADAKVAKWQKEGYMPSVVVRLVKDKLDSIDDLKAAAPMMMQLGTAIDEVVSEAKTAGGWKAVVKRGKETDLVYVRKFGQATVVCSAKLSKQTLGETVTEDEATKLCESLAPKN
ncbi:MAG: hypothetical protein HYV63_25660 [Candidatus Schekmanbacteria bacterium]|nr:hypothetical protein [Candidatus Schekmanbacteria bacterium]